MNHLFTAIEYSISTSNWYGSLSLSLTLPDLCGSIEYLGLKSKQRYPKWFNANVADLYTQVKTIHPGTPTFEPSKRIFENPMMGYTRIAENTYQMVMLNGDQCYGLRCAFLHQGYSEIREQLHQNLLNDFVFVEPFSRSYVHRNYSSQDGHNVLQLQVDVFCAELVGRAREWWSRVPDSKKSEVEIGMLKIRPLEDINRSWHTNR